MGSTTKQISRHEYNKPRLKEQIDSAMAAFIRAGRAVERLPTVASAETPAVIREKTADEEPSDPAQAD